jgi:RNA polymerase sigma-70 factor, ECF subfamily
LKGGFRVSDIKTDIYNQYKAMIYSYFLRSTLNSHISEELTQDTFLKAFSYFASFRGESSIKTWLFKIARNTYINYSKKNVSTDCLDDYEVVSTRDDYSRSDDRYTIRKILHRLSEEERTLIVLRDINNLSYCEIARVMEFTEAKVKISLHRARKKFRECYELETKEVR